MKKTRSHSLTKKGAAGRVRVNMAKKLRDGARCKVIGGTHVGKNGTVHDMKTGHVSVTVRQSNGERFKTLAKNVVVL
jgi:ribosomal protein S4E